MDLSIVIVNWNSCEYLKRCLASIVTWVQLPRYDVVVIDSGSFDGSDRMVRELFPNVRFIQGQQNVGFARANNLAFAQTTGDCVLFLNPDAELTGPAIDVLYSCLALRPDAGAIGGQLLNGDGTLQSSCIQAIPTIANQTLDSEWLRKRWPHSRLWGAAVLYEQPACIREVEAVSGACLMVRRQAFEEVGCFSESYFMYVEDVDLSYSLRQTGHKNYYVPDATVIHHGGSSSDKAVGAFAAVMMREAMWRFFRRTRGRGYALGYRLAMLASAFCRLGILSVVAITGQRSAIASSRKWLAILLWAIRRDNIVRRYYPDATRVQAEPPRSAASRALTTD